MRVPVFAASLLLTTVVLSGSVLAAVSVPLKPPAPAAKVSCPCVCPDAAKPKHAARRVPRRVARRHPRGAYYNYASAAPIGRQEWHGPWRPVPNEPYGDPTLRVDTSGWNGGVGYGADGGGGGGGAGFVDGYGQVHFAAGGGVQNGPTYNSYNQSFQYNPSVAGPFQPRLMGGIAPPHAGGRGR